MPLVNSPRRFFALAVSFTPAVPQEKRNRGEEECREKKATANERRYDESEKLAVSIERVIRSLKNTWTIIKPVYQRVPCQEK